MNTEDAVKENLRFDCWLKVPWMKFLQKFSSVEHETSVPCVHRARGFLGLAKGDGKELIEGHGKELMEKV